MTPQKADMVNHENSRKHRRASGESSDDSVTFRGVADALQEYVGVQVLIEFYLLLIGEIL